ncbi:MAG: ribosomal protein S18, partial [Actinomycetota bacterium]|nr:ribosomal protein S18 [Actinomycetota bacterium]
CTQHHREVAVAIKTARELALLPYLQRTVVERAGGRSLRVGGGERGRSGPPRAAGEGDGVATAANLPPEVGEPEALEPEALEPEALVPEALEPEALVPEALVPEAVEPELAES